MKKIMVKDWNEIQRDFDAMLSMRCVPTNVKKVPAGHIFDENKSVKWNRDEVERNNALYQKEVARLNTEKNKRRDAIYEDIYMAIQNEVGFNISREKAMAIWNCAYSEGHAFGISCIMTYLYEFMDLAKVLLA